MKIRNGFVSNSSSSSFIVRGIKISYKKLPKDILKNLPEDPDGGDSDGDMSYQIDEYFENKRTGLICKSTRDFFDGKVKPEVIIGIEVGDFEDGVVFEIEDTMNIDEKVISKLKKLGIEAEKLSTFVQYISNDNY